MRIQLRKEMHKMPRVLVFKKRQFWRFYFQFFVIFLSIMIFKPIIYASNGSLDLNQEVITNSQMQGGSSSDFMIRGQLFSEELNIKSKEAKAAEKIYSNSKHIIDFSKSKRRNDMHKSSKELLFQEYHPSVIDSSADRQKNASISFYLFFSIGAVFLIAIGVFFGKKQVWKRRHNKV